MLMVEIVFAARKTLTSAFLQAETVETDADMIGKGNLPRQRYFERQESS